MSGGLRLGGVPLPAGEVARRTRELAAMFEAAGEQLDRHAAAVEIANVLRPTVAVAVYIVQCAAALHHHPDHHADFEGSDEAAARAFVQEVRRFFPFFPCTSALSRKEFEWRGHRISSGTRTLLDLYGINHDARIWDAPERFRPQSFRPQSFRPQSFPPQRFRGRPEDPFGFVPQGGGAPAQGHRCPGEPIAVALTQAAGRCLTRRMCYEVPEQDLQIDMRRMPAVPQSRFVMSAVAPNG